ncbi:MAG: hypothetical protein U0P45_12390 [Acidimicrobiales bacterium]
MADRERWENYFRDVDKPQRKLWPIVVGGLALLVGLLAKVWLLALVGLVVVGIAVWIMVKQNQGELTAISQAEFDAEFERATAMVHHHALLELRLDAADDVIQELGLVGGAVRPLIEGRKKTAKGIQPNPWHWWYPWAAGKDTDGAVRRVFFGRYEVHWLFALEDAIAYYTVQWDMIDHVYATHYVTNRIYYRFIENVQLTENSFTIRTVSGQAHEFRLQVNSEAFGHAPNGTRPTAARSAGAHLDPVDRMRYASAQAFVSTVNQLRDEWERRQRHSG